MHYHFLNKIPSLFVCCVYTFIQEALQSILSIQKYVILLFRLGLIVIHGIFQKANTECLNYNVQEMQANRLKHECTPPFHFFSSSSHNAKQCFLFSIGRKPMPLYSTISLMQAPLTNYFRCS